jgi:hypothetical protein
MPRTKDTPGVVRYYETLQRIFRLESEVLTASLPHSGERGRNDEDRLRSFLARVLPRRFTVGSGFIVCSDPRVAPSRQTDVVIFDEINNSPLHRELAAFVYPVEMVYGTVEVKGTLTHENLLEACQAIRRVRDLGKEQHYIEYTSAPKDASRPEERVVRGRETSQTTAPRTFLFAYEKKGWRTIDDLAATLREVTTETGAHVHGLAVLSANWHLAQIAFTNPPEFHLTKGNALMHLVRGMLHSIASRRIGQASIDRYLRERDGKPESKVVPPSAAKSRRSRPARKKNPS